MIRYIISVIILLNALVLLAAAYSYLSSFLRDVFIDPLYTIASVGIIILSVIVMLMVKKGA